MQPRRREENVAQMRFGFVGFILLLGQFHLLAEDFSATLTDRAQMRQLPKSRFSLGATLTGEYWGPSWDFEIQLGKDSPWYGGLQFSYLLSQDSDGSEAARLLPTLLYRFPTRTIHPYAGIAMGTRVGDTSGNASASSPALEATLRIGLDIDLSSSTAVHLDPEFGLLRGNPTGVLQFGITHYF